MVIKRQRLDYCFQTPVLFPKILLSWQSLLDLWYYTWFSSLTLIKYDNLSNLKLEYDNHCGLCLTFISSMITYLVGSTCHIISNPVKCAMVRNRRLVKNAGFNLGEVSSKRFGKALKDWSLAQTSWENDGQ